MELVIRHAAMPAGEQAWLTFERDEETEMDLLELGRVQQTLTGDTAHPTIERETRARWRVTGVDQLGPGDICKIYCRIEAGGLSEYSAHLEVGQADRPRLHSTHREAG